MNCVIIGLGYFGNILKSKLENLEYKVITVDPYNEASDFKDIDDIAAIEENRYFITTPASTHHTILLRLFEKGVKNIWVEKPVCPSLEDTLDIFSKKAR